MKKKRVVESPVSESGLRKMFLIMKLSAVLFFMLMHAVYAGSFAQSKVTIEKGVVTYSNLFEQIKKQTGLTVVYSNNELNKNNRVKADFQDAELSVVLEKILEGTGLGYELLDEFIILKVGKQQQVRGSVWVTGMVRDEKNNPLPGVTVRVKETTLGTSTGKDGSFRVEIPWMEKTILVFSFVGMVTQEIPYTGESSAVNVTMKEDLANLEEVIVTGYGNIQRGNYTGAATTVKADDIRLAGVATIDEMLQGIVPGMLVRNTSGQVGSTPRVRVRGTSTILGSQEPVWVVDGVIQQDPQPFNADDNTSFSVNEDDIRRLAGNAISWLNPNDIETITVLKDASATAIYGSKAANGVIVITTKKAYVGKISVTYSGDLTIGQRPHYGLYDRMNSQEIMEFSKEMYDERVRYPSAILLMGYPMLINKLINKDITEEEFNSEYIRMSKQNTDWFDILFNNSINHNHSLSLSGGSEVLQNRSSFGYNRLKGEATGNTMSVFTASTNTTLILGDKLTATLQLNGTRRKVEGFAYGTEPFTYAYNTTRITPAYNEDGSLFFHEKWTSGVTSTVITNKREIGRAHV